MSKVRVADLILAVIPYIRISKVSFSSECDVEIPEVVGSLITGGQNNILFDFFFLECFYFDLEMCEQLVKSRGNLYFCGNPDICLI